MSKNLEIEFKNMLTKDEYYLLLSHFNCINKKPFRQTNFYFDTKDFDLKIHNCALRARILSDKIELTLKQKAKVGLIETTDIISENELNMLLEEKNLVNKDVYQALKDLNITHPLYKIAELTTYRIEIPYLNHLIAIDHSHFDNITDYEIELETNVYEEGRKDFLNLLSMLSIPRRKSISKIQRAYQYKHQL